MGEAKKTIFFITRQDVCSLVPFEGNGLNNKSRMSREAHVPFCEGEGVKFTYPTRLNMG